MSLNCTYFLWCNFSKIVIIIISLKFLEDRVFDQEGNGAFIYANNDINLDYFSFGFTAGFNIVYDGVQYKEWGRLYFDSNANGIYEGIHLYDDSSGIIPSTIGFGGEGIDEHYGYWYSIEYTRDRPNIEVATWNRNVDSWIGDFEGIDGYGRFEKFVLIWFKYIIKEFS